jgi:hypothetical protein
MAQTTYVSKVAVTLATRERAYRKLSDLCLHLHALNLNLISVVRRPDNFVEVTLNDELPTSQVDHLGLELPA